MISTQQFANSKYLKENVLIQKFGEEKNVVCLSSFSRACHWIAIESDGEILEVKSKETINN